MWLKLTYSLNGMYLSRPDEAPVTVPLPSSKAEATLWMRTFQSKDLKPQLCCDALIEWKVRQDTVQMFKLLSEGNLP